jgi:hypothetical protein
MLAGVIEIDHLSHMFALQRNDPALMLYDFTAACPSIARQLILDALTAFGAPQQVITVMSNFYQRSHLHIKVNGATYGKFEATRGIRQGCPL